MSTEIMTIKELSQYLDLTEGTIYKQLLELVKKAIADLSTDAPQPVK